MVKDKKIGLYKCILCTSLLFLFLYQFRLEVLGLPPQLHSTRIGALGIVILGIFTKKSNQVDSYYKKVGISNYCFLCLFILVYSFMLIAFIGRGTGLHMIDAALNNLVITIPVIWGLTNIFKDIDTFFRILVLVGLVQSVFIVLCLANESFQLFIDYTFNDTEEHNILVLRNSYAGGIGCITAPGMVRYTISVLAASYLYIKTERICYFIIYVFFAILNAMIARTGLIMDIICMLFILSQMKNTKIIVQYLFLVAVVCLILFLVVSSGEYDTFIEERFRRYQSLQENGIRGDFLDGYLGGQISNKIFIGTGILSGVAADGTVVRIDGGPLRVYSAAGLIFAIIIYISYFRFMIRNILIQINKRDKCFMSLLLVYLGIADFKEITLLIAWPMAIYFTISLLIYKSNCTNSYK